MKTFVRWVILAAAGLQLASAQTPLTFEVATVKATPPGPHGGFPQSPNKMGFVGVTLQGLISIAYTDELGSSVKILGGPDWIRNDRFDVVGQAASASSQTQLRQMLQTLLADRFSLRIHRETKEQDVFALVLARRDGTLGPKMKKWDGTCEGGRDPSPVEPHRARCVASMGRPPGLIVQGGSMALLAEMLSSIVTNLGRPVVDRTGLPGEFDLTLEYSFNPPNPNGPLVEFDGPQLTVALQEQLGLKLQAAKADVTVLVVDDARRPTEN